MNIKELAKLAKACRKFGILKYECAEFKFELTPEEPVKPSKTKAKNDKPDLRPDKILMDEFEGLSDEDKALWSVTEGSSFEGTG